MSVSMTWPQYLRNECTVGDVTHRMEHKEAEMLLLLLLGDPEKFLSCEYFTEMFWPDPDDEPDDLSDNLTSVYISRLRHRYGIAVERRNRLRGCVIDNFGGYRIPAYARASSAPLRMAA